MYHAKTSHTLKAIAGLRFEFNINQYLYEVGKLHIQNNYKTNNITKLLNK